jgi:hypothetical protein
MKSGSLSLAKLTSFILPSIFPSAPRLGHLLTTTRAAGRGLLECRECLHANRTCDHAPPRHSAQGDRQRGGAGEMSRVVCSAFCLGLKAARYR